MDNSKHLTLRDWDDKDKPREKFMNLGKKNLSDAELMAILLGSGSEGESAVSLAKRILNSVDNDLAKLARLDYRELSGNQFKGMGPAKSVTVLAALELGYRLIRHENESKNDFVTNSSNLFNHISFKLIDLPHEEFWAVYLNIRNKVLGDECISRGGSTETAVDIRQIFTHAFKYGAVAVAVVHNHPSGSLTPSRKDIDLTQKIMDASKVLRIQLIEHIVVGINQSGRPDYYSFHDNGLI